MTPIQLYNIATGQGRRRGGTGENRGGGHGSLRGNSNGYVLPDGLGAINRRQLKTKGFATSESGAVTMNDETRKALLVAYQERKREEITHPFLGERIEIGLLPHVQAMLLARHLRGDLDGYPPYIWK